MFPAAMGELTGTLSKLLINVISFMPFPGWFCVGEISSAAVKYLVASSTFNWLIL